MKSESDRRAWLLDWFGQLRHRLRNVRVCCGDWRRVLDSESVTTKLGLTGVFLDPPYATDLARMHDWVKHFQGSGPAPDRARAPRWGHDSSTNRDGRLYGDAVDDDRLVASVHYWALERGRDKAMRIVLAGYAGEHEALEAAGWSVVAWKAAGGVRNRSTNHRSRLAVKEALAASWAAGLSVREIARRCGASHGLVGQMRLELRTEQPRARKDNAGRERLWISPHCLKV